MSKKERNLKEDREFTCSREFAEWMIRKAQEDGIGKLHWEDAVMRYCSPEYPEMIREEIKKGNELRYDIDFDRENGTLDIHPTYDIVNILLPDRIGDEHFESATQCGPCTYSVLKTADMIPGYAHCRKYYDIDEDVLYSAVFSVTDWVLRECHAGEREIAAIKQRRPDDGPAFVFVDRYSTADLRNAVKNDFVDYYPGNGSTHCPDRMISDNACFNVVRNLLKECVGIIEVLGIKHDHPLLYAYELCRTILHRNICLPGYSDISELEDLSDPDDGDDCETEIIVEEDNVTPIHRMLEDADGRFLKDIKEAEKVSGTYGLTSEDLIYAFMRCEIKTEIEDCPMPVADYRDRPYIFAENDREDLFCLCLMESTRGIDFDNPDEQHKTPDYLELLRNIIA